MNNSETNPNFELPPVSIENPTLPAAPEALPSRPEMYTSPSQPNPVNQVQVSSQNDVPIATVPQTDTSMSSSSIRGSGPAIADDNDLIEKEWVVKAKQIVAATKDDPYRQNIEMSKFKADYIKKRYNKDIKVEGA